MEMNINNIPANAIVDNAIISVKVNEEDNTVVREFKSTVGEYMKWRVGSLDSLAEIFKECCGYNGYGDDTGLRDEMGYLLENFSYKALQKEVIEHKDDEIIVTETIDMETLAEDMEGGWESYAYSYETEILGSFVSCENVVKYGADWAY